MTYQPPELSASKKLINYLIVAAAVIGLLLIGYCALIKGYSL